MGKRKGNDMQPKLRVRSFKNQDNTILYTFFKKSGIIPVHSELSKKQLKLTELQIAFNKSDNDNGVIMSLVRG